MALSPYTLSTILTARAASGKLSLLALAPPPWRIHCAPNGPAIAPSKTIAKFSDPKRIASRTKPAQQVAVLIARLGE